MCVLLNKVYPFYLKMQNNIDTDQQWTTDLENVLDKIRINSTLLSEYHKERYYKYKGYLKYFRIPTIVLSAFSSVFSVGLHNFANQDVVSIVTCLIGLFVGILNSMELFLSISQIMESELTHSRDFYLLSVDIFKTLSLKREHRPVAGPAYLDDKYGMYCKLVENSILVDKVLSDHLVITNELIKDSVFHASKARVFWNQAIDHVRKHKDESLTILPLSGVSPVSEDCKVEESNNIFQS